MRDPAAKLQSSVCARQDSRLVQRRKSRVSSWSGNRKSFHQTSPINDRRGREDRRYTVSEGIRSKMTQFLSPEFLNCAHVSCELACVFGRQEGRFRAKTNDCVWIAGSG